jgi:hypothetical protein
MEDQGGDRTAILLKLHAFYAKEARHQRSMMWETVKWFSPVILALHVLWLWLYVDRFLQEWKIEVWICLAVLFFVGLTLCFICLGVMRYFYKSSLIHKSTFAKLEDELDFDKRTKDKKTREAFSEDNTITYQAYRVNRSKFINAQKYVKKMTKKGTLHLRMMDFFNLFTFISITEFCVILYYGIIFHYIDRLL